MGIGDWGLGIGQSPIPNPQSPIPITNTTKIYFNEQYNVKFLM
jgi:hypothetical protein